MRVYFKDIPEGMGFLYQGEDYEKRRKTRAAHNSTGVGRTFSPLSLVEVSPEDMQLHGVWVEPRVDGRRARRNDMDRVVVDKRARQRRMTELAWVLARDPSNVRALEIEEARIARKRVMLPVLEMLHRDDVHPAERKRLYSRMGYLAAVHTYNTFVEERELAARRRGEYPEPAVTLPFEVTANMPLTIKP